MIAFLEGTLIERGTSAVVAAGGGIGLDVLLTGRTAERLPAVGEPVRLWTHLTVREDNWTLYGFLEQSERAMFRLLLSVNGVGPKVALGILSSVAPADLALYLKTGDEKSLIRLPGIGKKSAARLVVELGQRVSDEMVPALGESQATTLDGSAAGGLGEAVRILGAMGLSPAQAEQALTRARADNPEAAEDLEAWVRQALQFI